MPHHRRVALAVIAAAACGVARDSGSDQVVEPPTSLSFGANPAVYTVGAAIAPNVPTTTGGPVAAYSVSPPLPAGLDLDPSTGVISGTPTAVTVAASYAVTASNSGGATTASVRVTVNDAPPAALRYTTDPGVYTVGVAIQPNAPIGSGGAVLAYSVAPPLPPGLSLDEVTGVISGTPTTATAVAIYTVSASNSGGLTASALRIGISPVAPSIQIQPPFQTVGRGDGAAFSVQVAAAATGALQLQWRKNGVEIPGATSTDYAIAATTSDDDHAILDVAVTDGLGFTTVSPGAVLIVVQGRFTFTGGMNAARAGHTATLLPDGRVLVVGGSDDGSAPPAAATTAEIYDPATRTFTQTGSPACPHSGHTATLLGDGKVLILGGGATSPCTAELYEPATGQFGPAGDTMDRRYHTATLLSNGKVLVAGGYDSGGWPTYWAEVYDPETNSFANTGSMVAFRSLHAAALLANGKVLVSGGNGDIHVRSDETLATAELYDPATAVFQWTAAMLAARQAHTLTVMNDGRVLEVGTRDGAIVDVYDPARSAFDPTGSLVCPRDGGHTAVLLDDGSVLVAGGLAVAAALSDSLSVAERYQPGTGRFVQTGYMKERRRGHTATRLKDGTVLVTGGYRIAWSMHYAYHGSAELYDPQF